MKLFYFLFLSFITLCASSISRLSSPKTGIMSSIQAKQTPTSTSTPTSTKAPAVGIPQGLKLVIGAGGIYAAFLYYGTLQEDVFHYKAADGSMFKAAWFLQALGKFVRLTRV